MVYSDICAREYWNAKGGIYRTRVTNVENILRSDSQLSDVTEINDAQLGDLGTLQQFDVVVLTRNVATTAAQRWALRTYVARGGGLVCMFGASRQDYTPNLNPRYRPFNIYWGFSGDTHMSQTWEWGEVSEMYSVRFCNDPLMYAGHVIAGHSPAQHPILAMTAADVGTPAWTITNGKAEYNELVWMLRGTNVVPLAYYKSARLGAYPNVMSPSVNMAAWANTYYYGRLVYFGFQLYDLAPYGGASRSLLLNSVRWAGSYNTYGYTRKQAALSGYGWQSGGQLWINETISDIGNTPLRGDLRVQLINPSGRTVYNGRAFNAPIPMSPGESWTHKSYEIGRAHV